MSILYEFIDKLDSLILFLSFSHDEVFDIVSQRRDIWFNEQEISKLPETKEIFKNQISNSAFLLGYSYFEAFLYELMRAIYKKHPEILPSDKKISFGEVVNLHDYKALIERIIEKELNDLFYKKMEDIIEYFDTKFSIHWLAELKDDTVKASLIRNCLLHNNGLVNEKLAKFEGYVLNNPISLSPKDVHDYGLKVRKSARDIYKQAEEKHLNRNDY
jgi:hypothetical protein